jgi:hypothetical protein
MCNLLELAQSKARVYRDEVELWKTDHEQAMLFFAFEDVVADGIRVFELVNRLDETIRTRLYQNDRECGAESLAAIDTIYDLLRRACGAIEDVLPSVEADFGAVRNAEKFRSVCHELRCMQIPDEEFFADDALVQLRDEAIDQYRGGETRELCGNDG